LSPRNNAGVAGSSVLARCCLVALALPVFTFETYATLGIIISTQSAALLLIFATLIFFVLLISPPHRKSSK
jgi:hypothetical protein